MKTTKIGISIDAIMSPAVDTAVGRLALPVGAMPAVGFGCWKLGKDIAAETSKHRPK